MNKILAFLEEGKVTSWALFYRTLLLHCSHSTFPLVLAGRLDFGTLGHQERHGPVDEQGHRRPQ